LANCIEYFQGRKTEGFEEERVALKKEVKTIGRGSTRGRPERLAKKILERPLCFGGRKAA
jgi:hypothetical protein